MAFLHPKSPNILNYLPSIYPTHRIGNHYCHQCGKDIKEALIKSH